MMYKNKIINIVASILTVLSLILICGCQKDYNLREPTFLKMGSAFDLSNAEVVFNISDDEKEIFGKEYPVYCRKASELKRADILEIFNFTENTHVSEDSLFDRYKDGDRTLEFYVDGRMYYNDHNRDNEMNQPIKFTADDVWDMAEKYLRERNMLPEAYIRRGTTEYRITNKLFKLGVTFRPTYNGCNTFGGSSVTVVYNTDKEVTEVIFAFTPYSYLKDTNTIEYEDAIKNFPWENSAIGFESADIQEVVKIEFTHCELQYYDYLPGEDAIQPCFMFSGLVYDATGNSTPIEYAVYAPAK